MLETRRTANEGNGKVEVSAPDRTNSKAEVAKGTHRSGISLRSSQSDAAVATSWHNQDVELAEGTRSNYRSETLAGRGLKPEDDAGTPVQTEHVQAFLERLPEIQAQLLEAETAPNKALAEFQARLTPIKMQLRPPLQALKDDYKTMDEMGVHRASRRPESRVGRMAIVFIFIAAEAIINGTFLAVGTEGGLIAGWLTALGISVFNVLLLGFAFGAMAFRQFNHRRLYRKLLGALLLCVLLVLAYSSNLLVAHYRDALDGPDPDNAGAAALATWLANPANPFKVSGAQSLWLLGLGIAFTFIGFIDGCLYDDPYPGYGRFYVEHIRRQAHYQSLFQKSFDELHDVAYKQESRLIDLAEEINKRLNDFLLLKARYASRPDDPDFAAWKRIEEGFPEARVNAVLNELKERRGKIFDEYRTAMRDLEALDPTINGEA